MTAMTQMTTKRNIPYYVTFPPTLKNINNIENCVISVICVIHDTNDTFSDGLLEVSL